MHEPDLLDQTAPPPAPSRWKRRLGCAGVPLLLLVTGGGGFYVYLIHASNADIRAAVAEADRREPNGWDFDAIEAQRVNPPNEENAALVVRAMKDKLPTHLPTPRPVPGVAIAEGGGDGAVGVPPPVIPTNPVCVDGDLADLPPPVRMDAALLRDLRASLEAAGPARDEAQKLPKPRDGHFLLQHAPNPSSTIINSEDALSAANLLHLEAALAAEEDRPYEAIRAVGVVVVVARSVGDEPFLMSMLIRIASDTVAVRSLERVLAQGKPSPDALGPFSATWPTLRRPAGFSALRWQVG